MEINELSRVQKGPTRENCKPPASNPIIAAGEFSDFHTQYLDTPELESALKR
jgi:hypothetical protein